MRGLNGEAKLLVQEGGSWGASDFSADGKKLLVSQYVSANDSRPGEVDLSTGKLTLFPIDGGKFGRGADRFHDVALQRAGCEGGGDRVLSQAACAPPLIFLSAIASSLDWLRAYSLCKQASDQAPKPACQLQAPRQSCG